MQIFVKLSSGEKHDLQVDAAETVATLKGRLAAVANLPEEQQRLVYKGRVLQDNKTLGEYGLEEGHVVHAVRSSAASNAATPPPSAMQSPAGLGGGLPGFAGGPAADEAAMMRQAMEMPGMQNMMSSLMDNPEILRQMVENNPMMRSLMERNPELAHIMNDPAVLRQAMDMARNPNLMREHMRNTDRAMSNLDTSPEAFNAMRRMYSEVQSPLMDAVSSAATSHVNAAPANPFATLFAPPPAAASAAAPSGGLNATPLPNPWAPAQPAAPQAGAMPQMNFGGGFPPGMGGMSGMGGMGSMGGMGGFGGGFPPSLDPAQMEALLSSPELSMALDMFTQNPQLMDTMISSQPQLQQMLAANPGMRRMLTDPAALRAMADPANLRAMAQMQTMMQQLGGMGMGGTGMDGLPFPGFAPAAPAVPLAELYASQLQQMAEMGFVDADANTRALQATGGNVNAAIERLLSG